ncbi:hypothetical protein ANN_10114 [Periplaneta americana]|uniref:Uncharacterized protein n=1 Tax=Periplaneta americana TaxID=6978 RepID=A0ABQ8TQ07_PERAM|nr:hypothetical protein ANN_10114 [Periplaneta americana]
MAGLCEGGNEPPGSLKGISDDRQHSLKCAKCKRSRPVCPVVQQEEVESITASSSSSAPWCTVFSAVWMEVCCVKWRRAHPSQALTKKFFAAILEKVVKTQIKAETLQKGFRACGLRFKEIISQHILSKFESTDRNNSICSWENEESKMLFTIRMELVSSHESPTEMSETQLPAENDGNKQRDLTQKEDNVSVLEEEKYISDANQSIGESKSIQRCVNDNQALVDNSLSTQNNQGKSPLSDILVWPNTPKRKGKRNIERMPFVLTSYKWQELHNEEEKKKLTLGKEKLERKRKREEKKEEKTKRNK